MANKKFLYGLTLGILGPTLYRSCKHIIKPIAIKSFGGFSSINDYRKELITDIKNEAEENRRKHYTKKNKYFENPLDESILDSSNQNNSHMAPKSAVKDLENQINSLKNQMNEFNKKMSQL